MTEGERNQSMTEDFDAMEAGEATNDEWWDAVLPSIHWCEDELRHLGFDSNYNELYEIVESDNEAC